MLLTKTVKMKWNNINKEWYESRGYIFTKYREEFEVKVEDLKEKSNVYVHVKCDCLDCKNPYLKPITWQNYKKYLHEDGKYYCRSCGTILFAIEKVKQTKLIKGKSFEKWCIENDRQDVLDRWDYELNNCRPDEISFSSRGLNHKGYYFKCLKGLHKSELKDITSLIRGRKSSIKCNQCNSFAQYLIDSYGKNAIELYWSDKNTLNPWNISRRSEQYVLINCLEKDYHENYSVTCSNFTKGSRCSYCAMKKVHPLDSLGKYLEDNNLLHLWSEKNIKSPYEYPQSGVEKVWWKCPDGKHEDFKRSINGSKPRDFRCGICSFEKDESILAKKVKDYLEYTGIYTILYERNCTIVPKNPKTNYCLPFDNEIKELKLIIEVHGVQHYKIQSKKNKWIGNLSPKEYLHKIQLHDRYKRIYAKSKGYHYLEIPYWTDNKQEDWKKLIDDKIKELKINNID